MRHAACACGMRHATSNILLRAPPFHPDDPAVRARDFLLGDAAVHGAAAGREAAAPDPRRQPGGVEHQHRLFSGRAPPRLPLRPCALHARRGPLAAADPRRRAGRREPDAAAPDRGRRAWCRKPGLVAADGAGRHRRRAVLRPVRHCPAAAGMVLADRRADRRRPVLPVCGEQRRKPAGIARLPAGGTGRHAACASGWLVGRVLGTGRADRCLRLRQRAPDAAATWRGAGRFHAGRPSDPPRALDRARPGALSVAARRDPSPRQRRGVGAVAVGDSAGAVPGDLHGGVLLASRRQRAATGELWRRWRRCSSWCSRWRKCATRSC